jgi:hypothetical protein
MLLQRKVAKAANKVYPNFGRNNTKKITPIPAIATAFIRR